MVPEGSGTSILLIEENQELREAMGRDFANQGFDVRLAWTGEEALEILTSSRILALVTSSEFPGSPATAFELIDRLAEGEHRPPVMVLTTDDPLFKISDAFQRGVDAVFVKPFVRITLEELVKTAVIPHLDNLVFRRVSRISSDFRVEATNVSRGGTIIGLAENIAQGGMFVAAKDGSSPRVGDEFAFRLFVEKDEDLETIQGKGVVMWIRSLQHGTRRFGFGLKFDLDNCEREKIFSLVNRLKTVSTIDPK